MSSILHAAIVTTQLDMGRHFPGDLNASTHLDPLQGNRSHELFFGRLTDFGLENVHALSSEEAHVQTLRHRNSEVAWHNDYFFVSTKLAARVKGYRVVDDEAVRRHSDHNIVAIDIEI